MATHPVEQGQLPYPPAPGSPYRSDPTCTTHEIDLTQDSETRSWGRIAHELAACTDAKRVLELAEELIEAIDASPGFLPSKLPGW
jgi:hypothetical protein